MKKPRPTQTEMKPIKVGQMVFREWCAAHGAVVDVFMAADLVERIERAIIAERAALSLPQPTCGWPAGAVEQAWLEGYLDGRRGSSRHQNDREWTTSEGAWQMSDTRTKLATVDPLSLHKGTEP